MISIFKRLKKNIINNIYTLKDITFDIENYIYGLFKDIM